MMTQSAPPERASEDVNAAAAHQLELLKSKIELIEADDRKASDETDKIILIGGPAAILASLTFMSDLAPIPVAGSITTLMLAWGALLVGAICGMVGLFTTRMAGRNLRRLYEAKLSARTASIEPSEYDRARAWNYATRATSWVGVAGFLLGIVVLLQFARVNLYNRELTARAPAVSTDSLATSALLRQCETQRCAIFIGYDYDLPRSSAAPKQAGSPITKSP